MPVEAAERGSPVIPPLTLHRPRSLPDALALAAELGDDARIYAGGTELLLVLREGFLEAGHLIDIKRIPEISGVRLEPADGDESGASATGVTIGAATVHTDVERSPVIRGRLPVLASLAADVANVRVRNTGTLGGNLCFAEPHGDPATFLIAADATLTLQSSAGRRDVPLEGWIRGPFEVDIEPAEVLTTIRIPNPGPGTTFAYRRFRSLERPSAAIAVRIDAEAGRVRDCRVVLGCAGPMPARLAYAEAALIGAPILDLGEAARSVGRAAADEADVDEDAYGPAEYKRQLVDVLTRRAVLDAVARQAAA